jgi:hypothetical protein
VATFNFHSLLIIALASLPRHPLSDGRMTNKVSFANMLPPERLKLMLAYHSLFSATVWLSFMIGQLPDIACVGARCSKSSSSG